MEATLLTCGVLLVRQIALVGCAQITTPSGEIVGSLSTVTLGNVEYFVDTYLGIPYAKPPVGDLRFKKPQPLDTTYDNFQAVNVSPKCPQLGFGVNQSSAQSEDCLYLNIYVPQRAAESASGHAVMIWIHGGGFTGGSGGEYDGSLLAHAGNVIVVTINYRLGVFGFLSTMDEHMPPNIGLWDQRFALEWVKKHIASFGGDLNRITIFGESAGSVSCSIHSLYPANSGLFQRVIQESGSATMPLTMDSDLSPGVKLLASHLGCETSESLLMVKCLKSKNWDAINAAAADLMRVPENMVILKLIPTVDGEFVKMDPRKIYSLMKTRNLDEVLFYQSLDIISGFNSHDGALQIMFVADPNNLDEFKPTRDSLMTQTFPELSFMAYGRHFPEALYKLMLAEYTNWTNPESTDSIRLQFVKFYTDVFFMVPAIEMVHIHQYNNKNGKSYVYNFTAKPSISLLDTPSWVHGANHADEIPFVFGLATLLTPWEQKLAENIIMYWSTFAKTGNPSSSEQQLPNWPEWESDTQFYIELDRDMGDHSVKQFVGARETNFWMNVLPDIVAFLDDKDEMHVVCSVSSASRAPVAISALVTAIISVYFIVWK